MTSNEDGLHTVGGVGATPQNPSTHQNGLRTVGEVAKLLGLSVRTLHHWEERGLISPMERSWSNYRLYSDQDIATLQRVIIYRATGMSLESIATLIHNDDDPVTHLRHQHNLLMEKEKELHRMIDAVNVLLEDAMNNKQLSVDEVAQIIGEANFPVYQAEAAERWGETDDWKISQQNASRMSKKDWETLKETTLSLEKRLAEGMKNGIVPGSSEANALAEEHRKLLSAFFPVSHSKQVLIARGYIADPRFRAHYENVSEGLAQWLHEIINANASAQGVDPNTAQWR